jgi:hypothetical protein
MNYQYIALGSGGLSILVLAALVWLFLKVRKMDRLRKEFYLTDETKKIDDAVMEHHEGIKRLSEELQELGNYTTGLAQANRKNFQKMGYVRFDPFGDASGAISFVLTVLDAENNGIVISSLHGREGNRVYAKQILLGASTTPLTEEEQEAIKRAA